MFIKNNMSHTMLESCGPMTPCGAGVTDIPEGVVKYYNKSLAWETTEARGLYVKLRKIGARGESMSAEELLSYKVIRDAQTEVKQNGEEPTINSKDDRSGIRNKAAQNILDMGSMDEHGNPTGPVAKGKKLFLVIGPPAAGKSSALANVYSQHEKARIIDSDDIKKMIPEFNGPGGAGIVHEESKVIQESLVLPKFFDKNSEYYGDNLVIPIVGQKESKVERFFNQASEAGYEVHLSLNTLQIDKCLNRMVTRAIETGRFIDMDYLQNIGDNPKKAFDKLIAKNKANGGGFASFTEVNNDVQFGEKPKKVRCLNSNGEKIQFPEYLSEGKKSKS